jgi:polyketide cyclase/dehydrase/lipid transport protein
VTWVLISIAILVLSIFGMWIIGARLPKGHVATRAARFRQPPEVVWGALVAVEEMPSWRKELKAIERRPDVNGRPSWIETSSQGVLPLVVVEWDPPRRMVAKIEDPQLPFGGTWTYEIGPVDGGSMLRITERGEVYPALFRFLARFVFGYTRTIESYLRSLGSRFGETIDPRG